MKFRKIEKKHRLLKNLKNKTKEYLKNKINISIHFRYFLKKIFQYYRFKIYKKKKSTRYRCMNSLFNTIKSTKKDFNGMFLWSMHIRDSRIIDLLIGKSLSSSKIKSSNVCRQTRSGRQYKKKICVATNDRRGYLGIAMKSARDPISGFISASKKAKLKITKIRRGFWEKAIGKANTVKFRTGGRAGSVIVVLFPAPGGFTIKSAINQKKVIACASITDCYSKTYGHTKTAYNAIKATFVALTQTFKIATPDIWKIIF
uniref:Ribosomal protein S2 n=1 Tax=Lotharella vacuolata TaxID=74820 RepID=A0A0H5BQT9_9EUKA|nr:ribosomal protein S2 [Lotharella vacuolata]